MNHPFDSVKTVFPGEIGFITNCIFDTWILFFTVRPRILVSFDTYTKKIGQDYLNIQYVCVFVYHGTYN